MRALPYKLRVCALLFPYFLQFCGRLVLFSSANFVTRALPLKQLFVQYFQIPSTPVKCVRTLIFSPVLFSEVFCFACLSSRTPVFVPGPFDLHALLTLCYFVLVACLPKFPAPIFRFSLLPWWPERVSYALVGLLTLRLLSLGWRYVAYPLRLKFVLFLQFTFLLPLKGWKPLNGLLMSFFSYSHNDPLAQLLARVRSLEDANNATAVPAHLVKITQYGFRREQDFEKYVAHATAEQLATAAKLAGDEKASTYDATACTLREKLPVPKKQLKAYFVALLADKEYAKVLEAVAKGDKSFKTSASSSRG